MSSYLPDFETFEQLARQAALVPVYRQLLSDTLTPVAVVPETCTTEPIRTARE